MEDKPWQVGEALAETLLQEDMNRKVVWPWNGSRDRKTPRASLPGADLVGFVKDGEEVRLLLGEVKTSSDSDTPPGVMNGKKGMAWQLNENAANLEIHHAIWKWLLARCKSDDLTALFRSALATFLESKGKSIVIVGDSSSPLERTAAPGQQSESCMHQSLMLTSGDDFLNMRGNEDIYR